MTELYRPFNWKPGAEGGTLVTDERLNNLERGIQQALANIPDVALPDAVMTSVASDPTTDFAILQSATIGTAIVGKADVSSVYSKLAADAAMTEAVMNPVAVRTNETINPDFATSISGWSQGNAAAVMSWDATGRAKFAISAAGTAANALLMYETAPKPYTLGQLKSARTSITNSTASSKDFRIGINPYTAGGALAGSTVYGATVSIPAGSTQDLTVNGASLTDPTAVQYRLVCFAVSALVSGDVVYIDNALTETASTAGTFFSGNTPTAGILTYAFLGPTNASASIQYRRASVSVNEAPLTPYRFGAVPPVSGSDNTAAISAMFASANAGVYNPSIYIPEGIWYVNPTLVTSLRLTNGLTVKGAGRENTRIYVAALSVPLFSWNNVVAGVHFSDLKIESQTSIFAPGTSGGIYGSLFENLFLQAGVAGARVWYQNGAASFIHNTFSNVEMQRIVGATVPAFHIIDSGGAANFNRFQQVRMNGLNNVNTPFMMVETSMAQTYLTDWTFTNILGEQNPGGLIHSKGACNWTIINATDEDSTVPYANDIIRMDANASGLNPRDITIMNSGRRGQSMGAGFYEVYVAPAAGNTTVVNCNPLPTSGQAKLSLPRNATVIGVSGYPRNLFGTGSPEGVVTSVPGSTYARTDGGASTSFYVKESGTGATGWIAK